MGRFTSHFRSFTFTFTIHKREEMGRFTIHFRPFTFTFTQVKVKKVLPHRVNFTS